VSKSTNSSWEHQTKVSLHFPDDPDVQYSVAASDLSAMRKEMKYETYEAKINVQLFNSLAKHSFSCTESILAKRMFLVQQRVCAAMYECCVRKLPI